MTSILKEKTTTTHLNHHNNLHIRNSNNTNSSTSKRLTTATIIEEETSAPVPDSTTIEMMTEFCPGQDVLLKQKDGRYYLGTVVEVDAIVREQCLIKFGDNTERWSSYKDLTKLTTSEEQERFCVVCKKLTPKNRHEEVIVCDKCSRGYHQKCHQPEIPIECQKDGSTWMCKRCIGSEPHNRLRKNDSKYLRRESFVRNNNTSTSLSASSSNNNIAGTTTTTTTTAAVVVSSTKVLPYDINSLNWDTYHRVNLEHTYCYCGDTGKWYKQMLQCGRCRQWFHERCLLCLQFPLYCGDRFYVFVCSICNYGKEFLRRLEMKWVDVVHLMLFNLTEYNSKKYYDLDKIIIPYINDNWHVLQLPPKIFLVSKAERRENILSVLTNNRNRFKCGREIKKRTTIWGLRVRLPPPSPTISLPTSGSISEEELKELWQGNRRLQFLTVTATTTLLTSSSLSLSSTIITTKPNNHINITTSNNNKTTNSCIRRMKDIMMGIAYQQNNTPSETDSPCPSPEVDRQPEEEEEDDDDDDDNNKIKLMTTSYIGGGCVKKSAVSCSNLQRRKYQRLLTTTTRTTSNNSNNRERIMMKRSMNKRQMSINDDDEEDDDDEDDDDDEEDDDENDGFINGNDVGECSSNSSSSTATTTRQQQLLQTRLSLVDNKINETTTLPLTPPTSVSGPPTPPAFSSTSSSSALDLMNNCDFSSVLNNNNNTIIVQTKTKTVTTTNKLTKTTTTTTTIDSNEFNHNNATTTTPSCDTSGDDETSSKSTLDLIIPPPKDFEGKNNPFLTLLRGSGFNKKARKPRKSKDSSMITLPLPLTAVIPGKPVMRPMKRQLSEKDIVIGPNGEVKRRRLRRSNNRTNNNIISGQTASKTATVLPVKTNAKEWGQRAQQQQQTSNNNNNSATTTQINNCVDYALNSRRLRQRPDKTIIQDNNNKTTTVSVVSSPPPTTTTGQTTTPKPSPVKQESDINMDDLKSSVNIYFGAANRIAAGERFTIKAKRIGPTGKLEFLIEWEGPANGMT